MTRIGFRPSFRPNSDRILNTARGILIGLRRCRSDVAFDELHGAAQRHKVPVFAMAWALVHLAGGGENTTSFSDAQSAARHEWGQLFGAPRNVDLLRAAGAQRSTGTIPGRVRLVPTADPRI